MRGSLQWPASCCQVVAKLLTTPSTSVLPPLSPQYPGPVPRLQNVVNRFWQVFDPAYEQSGRSELNCVRPEDEGIRIKRTFRKQSKVLDTIYYLLEWEGTSKPLSWMHLWVDHLSVATLCKKLQLSTLYLWIQCDLLPVCSRFTATGEWKLGCSLCQLLSKTTEYFEISRMLAKYFKKKAKMLFLWAAFLVWTWLDLSYGQMPPFNRKGPLYVKKKKKKVWGFLGFFCSPQKYNMRLDPFYSCW